MPRLALLTLAGLVLTGCMDAQTQSTTSAQTAGAEQSMTDRARFVADKYGASPRFVQLSLDRGAMKRAQGDSETQRLCEQVETRTRTLAGLDAVSQDDQTDVYVCAGFLS